MRVDRVDVLICTNSDGAYLAEALDSVERQTWPHWTVTVIDDGSSTPAALDRAVQGRDRMRVLHREHRGLPAARNAGLAATDAGWVTFLDDDDVWDPRRLELLVGAREGADGVIAAYSGGWHMDSEGRSMGGEWDAQPVPSSEMLRGRVPPPRLFTLLADRTAIETAGPFDESYSLGEDNEFMLRFLATGELVAVPERLVGYRRHDSNMTLAVPRAHDQANTRLLTERMRAARDAGDVRLYGLLREGRRRHLRIRARLRTEQALHDLRRGRIVVAARAASSALAASPVGVLDGLVGKLRGALGRRAPRSP